METLLIILATGAVCIASFFIGSRIGAVREKAPQAERPSVDPLKHILDRQERKKAKANMERYEALMRNIEAYDGTSEGQKDLPGGG